MFQETRIASPFDLEPLEPCFWDTPRVFQEDNIPLGVFYKAPFEIDSPTLAFGRKLFEEEDDILEDLMAPHCEPQDCYKAVSTTTEAPSVDILDDVITSKCAKLPAQNFSKNVKSKPRKLKKVAKSTISKPKKSLKKRLPLKSRKSKKLTKVAF